LGIPTWPARGIEPADEAELLELSRRLTNEDLERFILQIRAVVERDHRKWIELMEEDYERTGR